jgi:predicted  nucleic acid-binding Zn-ribbon protein
MNIKSPSKSKGIDSVNEQQMQKNKIQVLVEHWETKIKQIQKRISQNEVRLESMESHSDYEYKDLLRESNEAEKDHKKDLKLLIDLLCKYSIRNR